MKCSHMRWTPDGFHVVLRFELLTSISSNTLVFFISISEKEDQIFKRYTEQTSVLSGIRVKGQEYSTFFYNNLKDM